MHTLLTNAPAVAAAFIRRGEVVAFPTETVFGVGADAFDAAAVRKIFEAKGRPADNPLIVHLADLAQLDRVAARVPEAAQQLIDAFFPGPLTLILPRHADVPPVVTGGLETVGVRMPRHAVAEVFLRACGRPVAAPSANRSGRPSPTTWQAAYDDLEGRVACILQDDRTDAGLESTVVDCTGEVPLVLRPGAVSLERLQGVLPTTRLADAASDEAARSPGTRYRHYAPRARVFLIDDPAEAMPRQSSAYLGLHPPPELHAFGVHTLCQDVETYARELFHFFRRCDAAGIQAIYCEKVAPEGLGLALMDRLRRAAQA